jgi:alpha-L-rhamnosidase
MTKTPQFAWSFENTKDRQSAYRIVVAASLENAQNGVGDVWDSGEVASQNCLGVRFAGKQLQSATEYFWKLFVKDKNGVWAESEVQTFETALFEKSDWRGTWTAMPANFVGGSLRFRKILALPENKKIVKARAYVCGLGYHEFYVNGEKIGNEVLNPSVTEYAKRVEYVTYDFTAQLEENKQNVVAFELGNGWYGARKLMAQFYVYFDDGSMYEDHSAPVHGWWVSGSPIIDNSIYGGEIYDATLEEKYPLNWATRDFEPTWGNGWMYTIATDAPVGVLEAQSINPIRVKDDYPTVNIVKKADNVFVYDVGQNLAGWAKIKVRGERGASVTLKFAEDVTEDGYANQLNLRSARCSDTYILRGDGEEEYEPKFTYHGFRYVQVEIKGVAEVLELVAKHVHSDVRIAGSFACSNDTLNKLHKNAQITELNNLHSIMTDCPQRDERFGWLNDLSARLFQTVYNCGMERFFPKFARDIKHTQQADGAIADTAPYYTGGKPADPVCIAYLLMGTLSYKYYGNARVCEEEYGGFKGWVEYLLSRSKDYLMDYYWYADWVPPECFADVKTDGLYVSTTYLYWHLKSLAKAAKIAGKTDDAKLYEEHAARSKEAIINKYFDEENTRFGSGTQTENALALWLGIAPEAHAQKIADNLYADVVKHGYHSTCGNIGYRHLFYALSDYGYTDAVVKILTNPEYPGWGYMIANGATTVWERWEKEMQNVMHSFDHPMFGSYDAWLYHYLGGISVDEDACGADKITVKPYIPTDIDFVECSFETLRGKIVSNWVKQNDGSVLYRVEVPPMTTATIIIGDKTHTLGCGEYEFISGKDDAKA